MVDWDRKLARPLTLADGTTLHRLRCVAECLIAKFAGISEWSALEQARDLLMAAARSGRRRDIEAAARQAEIVLLQRGLM